MTDYREILRLSSKGLSRTSIGEAIGCSRNTVSDVLKRAEKQQITWPLPENMSDSTLEATLFPAKAQRNARSKPDYEKIHKELGKPGVTFTLLWDEYCDECRQNGEIPYAFTQFRYHYYEYAQTEKATMHLNHKPGEEIETDWAGQTMTVTDTDTGEALTAYVFVGTLPCSGYSYVEAFLSQNEESWITAHIHMFRYFGGCSRILVPDNLKTGVDGRDRYDVRINKSYNECAEYYGSVVIPARVRHPKDKPSVEGTVGNISTWIIASLRNRTFFSLSELNDAVIEKLRGFNEKPFKKKPGSRYTAYINEEKDYMLPLPASPYEFAQWRKLTVGFNYHVSFDKNFYSVPYDYIKHEMDVRVTGSVIEIYYNNQRVCSHKRLYGKPGQYSTIQDHMPEKHQQYLEWNGERFISWAQSIGENTFIAVKAILSAHKIEQQGYRACMGILKLAERYGKERLESACGKALSYTPNPTYKAIDSILKSGSDIKAEEPRTTDNSHAFLRGAEYYGRKK